MAFERRIRCELALAESISGRIGRKKLTHQGFRIEEATLTSLRQHAQRRNISLNALVNSVLTNYSTRDIFFEELGSIPVPKGIMRALFSCIPKDELAELGRRTGPSVREHIAYLFRDVNSESLLSYLDLAFSRFHACQHHTAGTRHSYSIIHDINLNFSMFYQGFLEGLITPIVRLPMKWGELTEGTLSFEFIVGDHRTGDPNFYLEDERRLVS